MNAIITKRYKAKWIIKLKNYQFHTKYFSDKENYMIVYLLQYPIKKLFQML